jgi:hypothetical protein
MFIYISSLKHLPRPYQCELPTETALHRGVINCFGAPPLSHNTHKQNGYADLERCHLTNESHFIPF